MKCIYCQISIPEERVQFLTENNKVMTCICCSSEKPMMVLMDYGHKTAGYAVPIPQNKEAERLAVRCYRRAR